MQLRGTPPEEVRVCAAPHWPGTTHLCSCHCAKLCGLVEHSIWHGGVLVLWWDGCGRLWLPDEDHRWSCMCIACACRVGACTTVVESCWCHAKLRISFAAEPQDVKTHS